MHGGLRYLRQGQIGVTRESVVERERLKGLEESASGFEYVKFEYLPGPRRTDQILHFLDEEHPERVFVWAHYLEPHEPYDVHPGGPGPTASDRERYDGEVRAVDDEIRRLEQSRVVY